jgi:tetratricopeptide (TPR) repeat protein
LDEALSLLDRAIDVEQRRHGADHPTMAILFGELAKTLRNQGEKRQARMLLDRALAIQEKHFGPSDPRVALTLGELGVFLRMMNDPQAEGVLRRAIALGERTLGSEHPSLAQVLYNLALITGPTGQPRETRTLLERALAIGEISQNDGASMVAILFCLSNALQSLSEDAKALEALERAETIIATDPTVDPMMQALVGAGRDFIRRAPRPGDPEDHPLAPVAGPASSSLRVALQFNGKCQMQARGFSNQLRTAIEVAEERGDVRNAARALLLLGHELTRKGESGEGQKILQQGAALAKRAQEPLLEAEAQRMLDEASKHRVN